MCLMPPPMMLPPPPPPPGPLPLPDSRVGPEESWVVLFIRGPRSGGTKKWTEGEKNEEKIKRGEAGRKGEMEERISKWGTEGGLKMREEDKQEHKKN